METSISESKIIPDDGRKVFRKLGTCSRTFFHLLNREFGHLREVEERAADPLAGGILQQGHQCGMLWGSSLAVGAEAYRRCESLNEAIPVAITATQSVMKSFAEREDTINCRDVTNCDFSNKLSFAKYMITGRFLHCFKIAQEWAPEAIEAAIIGLSEVRYKSHDPNISCASELVKKMGGSEEEIVMAAGFAGGLGLSGGGCGVLSAAIWMKSLDWCETNEGHFSFKDPSALKLVDTFNEVTDSKILCHEICGREFSTIEDHSEYIRCGGCNELIEALARTD